MKYLFKISIFHLILFLSYNNFFAQDTFSEDFAPVSYNNNDNGSQNWGGGWIENGELTNPIANRIFINSNARGFGAQFNNQLALFNLDGRSISRDLDLSAYTNVTLDLDYDARFRGDEVILVELFNNDSGLFEPVATINTSVIGSIPTITLNSNQISSNSSIRFSGADNFWGNEAIFVDNIIFEGTVPSGISINDVTVNENAGTATFTVTYNGPLTLGSFTVPFSTNGATATSGTDFNANAGTVTLGGVLGATQADVVITINEDNFFENTETFEVNLGNPSNNSITVSDPQGIGTITDNDVQPTISISDVVVNEDEPNAIFSITYAGSPIEGGFTINYSTNNQNAIAGSDYSQVVSSVFFSETTPTGSQNISIPIIQSVLPEITETFEVNLTAPSTLVNITDNQGIGSILDNDDIDNDGITDNSDNDIDNDGIPNCEDNQAQDSEIADLFSINGDASQDPTNPLKAVITENLFSQAGSITINDRIDFAVSFNFEFIAFLGNDNNGADGLAIIFHNDPAGAIAVGEVGNGLGARGIQNGIVLELDTFFNGNNAALGVGPDINPDHGTIWLSETQVNLTTPVNLGNLEDGNEHTVRLVWDANSTTLEYFVDGTSAGSINNDLITNVFGTNLVYFGFSGSTGGSRNLHTIEFGDLCDVPLFIDTDNDGIPNLLDLDSDNDGILDVIEGGNGALDTNNDGRVEGTDSNMDGQVDASVDSIEDPNTDSDNLPDFIDPDNDNDSCLDAIEASGNFTNANIATISGFEQLSGGIDSNGIPNVVSPNGQAINTAVIISGTETVNTSPVNVITTAGANDSFNINISANGNLTYQWQQRLTSTSPWTNLTNGGTNPAYVNVNANTLNLNRIPLSLNGSQYRVLYINSNNQCDEKVSTIATLTVRVATVITNRRITFRVKK